jgi:hypothetical protein
MPAPRPIRLFHITAIANLPAICAAGALLSKNQGAANGVAYQNIAHGGAQGARAVRRLPDPPGGCVHDYVPFYFAPRSPMLFAVNGGKVEGCALRQADIVHIETTVEAVTATGAAFVFFDRNATLAYSKPYTDLNDIDHAVAWDLLTEPPRLDGFRKYWQSRHADPRHMDRMERRMAEFLVNDRVALNVCTGIGVFDAERQAEVSAILEAAGVKLPVMVVQEWYFLGQ